MDKVSYHLVRGDRAENPFGTIVGKNAFFRAMNTLDQTEFADERRLNASASNRLKNSSFK